MTAQPSIPTPLTPKQRRCIEEYRRDCNAAAAARRSGYSTRTARQIGHRLLSKVNIATALADCRRLANANDAAAQTDGQLLANVGIAAERANLAKPVIAEAIREAGLLRNTEVAEGTSALDPDLAKIIAAWPRLSAADRGCLIIVLDMATSDPTPINPRKPS